MTTPAEVAKMRERFIQFSNRATPAPWTAYCESDVGMPLTLFSGTPGQSGFTPLEPLSPADIDLIALLRNESSTMLADLVAERDRMREALEAIDYHKDNQDMNHLDFRIYAGSEARAALEGNKS